MPNTLTWNTVTSFNSHETLKVAGMAYLTAFPILPTLREITKQLYKEEPFLID